MTSGVKLIITIVSFGLLLLVKMFIWDPDQIGTVTHTYKGVPVYENGIMFFKGHGKHYAKDGYYYGQKWQCVEYIKRFYKDAFNHEMPFGWGHARDFFDSGIQDGALNKKRGLIQYKNGSPHKPAPDDVLIFQDTQYGHVGIVEEVLEDRVIMVQQNIFGKPKQTFMLSKRNNGYYIESPRTAAGWLRMPE